MRVAILSYPMLFQRTGGLQIQIKETITELNQLGIDSELINPNTDNLKNYDLIHIFSAINGNHRLVEAAKGFGKPVVLSPLIQPDWTHLTGIRGRILDRLVGKVSNWQIQTTYREINICLQESNHIIALGEIEKRSIQDAFLISENKISVIPNGIPKRFFQATPNLFVEEYSIETGFILCAAAINSHKNQLTLVEALKDTSEIIVLIGQSLETDKDYLAQLLKYPNVRYLGSMDYRNPLLPSAYAAAGVFCLPSHSEVMPLCVLESLAAGTPAVITKNHCMETGAWSNSVIEIAPNDQVSISKSIKRILTSSPKHKDNQYLVRDLSWSSVAKEISSIYEKKLSN